MSETLLTSTNRILKRVRVIQGEDGELPSLTDSARQTYIDLAIDLTNEVIQEIYSSLYKPLPKGSASATITLSDGVREYDLPSDLVEMRWPLINQTTGRQIYEFGAGFETLRRIQIIPSQYIGLPFFAVISPITGKLYMDRIPTSDEAGDAYDLLYDKSLVLSVATDTFPFSDDAVLALVPAIAQLWKKDERSTFDAALFTSNIGRAARLINPSQPRRSY